MATVEASATRLTSLSERVARTSLPAGYGFQWAGTAQQEKEAGSQTGCQCGGERATRAMELAGQARPAALGQETGRAVELVAQDLARLVAAFQPDRTGAGIRQHADAGVQVFAGGQLSQLGRVRGDQRHRRHGLQQGLAQLRRQQGRAVHLGLLQRPQRRFEQAPGIR